MIRTRDQRVLQSLAPIAAVATRTPRRWETILVIALLLVLGANPAARSLDKQSGPAFWRGVYLFGMPLPESNKAQQRFLEILADSLFLNVVQVRTYGHPDREGFFLENSAGLWILLQDQDLAQAATRSQPEVHIQNIEGRLQRLRSQKMLLRYYLVDEPLPKHYAGYRKAAKQLSALVDDGGTPALAITTLAEGGSAIKDFVAQIQPTELVIDPYFITNNIPHPSLKGRDDLAKRVRIFPWGSDKEGYGWYFGFLQQGINKALEEHHRVAAEVVRTLERPLRLVIAPQLHGILFRSSGAYDQDTSLMNALSLRPPAPSEISLQYGLGLAYGAKGFLGYPYGFDAGYEKMEEVFTGLVSGDPSGMDHTSNVDTLYGRESVWTGYAEKWREFQRNNKRLAAIGDLMASLTWVGAKSWSMSQTWEPDVRATAGWKNDIVAGVGVTIPGDPYPGLPQVEIGQLAAGGTDYLVVVNRRCAQRDRATITVQLGGGRAWTVRDIERPGRTLQDAPVGEFSDQFDPGQWRVYSLHRY